MRATGEDTKLNRSIRKKMTDLRVALFTGNYNHIEDGVSRTLNRLVKFLEEAGVQVLVFGPTVDNPPIRHEGRFIAVPSVSIPGRPEYRFSLSFPEYARSELRRFNPHLVHIATPDLLGLKALNWARRNERKVVTSFHTHFASYLKYYRAEALEPLLWRYLRWFYNQMEQIYVPADSIREELQQHGISADMRIWARGVDTSLFSPTRRDEAWRRTYGFEEDDVVVLFVSRLVREKNLDEFASTVNKIRQEVPSVRALVVGDGPAFGELQEQLPDAVYTGFLKGEELACAYASSDLFFFPSDTEAFGNVTLEAMASGLPCVVADAAGSRALVEDGVNGFRVRLSGPEPFYGAVLELVKDKELRRKMGEASLRKAGEFSWSQINGKLVDNYRAAIGNNGA